MLRCVDRAKKIEPSGQVVISQSDEIGDLLLENSDIIRVPVKDGQLPVSGEVLFPNAIAFDNNTSVGDHINRALSDVHTSELQSLMTHSTSVLRLLIKIQATVIAFVTQNNVN